MTKKRSEMGGIERKEDMCVELNGGGAFPMGSNYHNLDLLIHWHTTICKKVQIGTKQNNEKTFFGNYMTHLYNGIN